MSTEAACGVFEPAWPSRPSAPPAGDAPAGRYRPPPLRGVAADPDPGTTSACRSAPPLLAFDENDLARAFGAGVRQGLRAVSGAASAQRDRAIGRALRLLYGARRRLAAAQAQELDRIADHAAALLGTVIDDLTPAGAGELALPALRGLLREALSAGAGAGTITVETTEDVVAALRPALARQDSGTGAAAVELRVDPELPSDALRVRWSAGWAEARAAAVVALLRERLAVAAAQLPEGDPA